MLKRGLYFLLLFVCTAVLADDHNYSNQLYLDPQENYQMFWSYSADTIRFKIRVATTGYVGFGLSSNGGMAGADIVVAWVKDGEANLYDMHGPTYGNNVPLLDDHEDWVLVEGQEKEGFTEITFGRNLITCDDAADMDITVNTMRVIWSYGVHDPESISNLHQVQHTSLNRGTRSVALIHSDTDGQQPTLPDNAYTHDVTMKNHNIHQSDTTYWCKTSRIGKDQQRDQIIAMEPLIQAGNEGVVHHFVLNTCIYQDPLPEGFEGDEFLCSENGGMDEEDLPYNPKCEQLVGIWAVGGETYYFPENVGYKIGNVDEEMFYKLEIHYDNPDNRVDIIDSSGYRLWFSPTERKHDAGMLMFFANHNGFYNIPPHTDDFIVRHYCPTEILDQAFEISGTTEINLLAYSLHAHLAGISARMRHFRNESEMDAYAYDETYDFNYQTFRMLDDVQLKKGDSIMVECNSKNPGDQPVFSGEGTNQEMCLVYIMYYPAVPFISCGSEVLPLQQLQTVQPEITSFDYEANTVTSEGAFEGMTYQEVMEQATWDAGLLQQYQDLLLTNHMVAYIPELGGISGYYDVPSVPREAKRAQVTCIEEVPAPEKTGLRRNHQNNNNAGASVATSVWMVFLVLISLLLTW